MSDASQSHVLRPETPLLSHVYGADRVSRGSGGGQEVVVGTIHVPIKSDIYFNLGCRG